MQMGATSENQPLGLAPPIKPKEKHRDPPPPVPQQLDFNSRGPTLGLWVERRRSSVFDFGQGFSLNFSVRESIIVTVKWDLGGF